MFLHLQTIKRNISADLIIFSFFPSCFQTLKDIFPSFSIVSTMQCSTEKLYSRKKLHKKIFPFQKIIIKICEIKVCSLREKVYKTYLYIFKVI